MDRAGWDDDTTMKMKLKPLAPSETNDLVTGLNRVARNLWWTWNQGAQDLFRELSPRGWQNLFHNAVAVLHEVSETELRARLQDRDFAERVGAVIRDFDAYLGETDTWVARHAPQFQQNPVAYFSAEFGFHETLPDRRRRSGVLAGDHAKSASDLGLGLRGDQPLLPRGLFHAGHQPG
jgi:glycogen phosphorylase